MNDQYIRHMFCLRKRCFFIDFPNSVVRHPFGTVADGQSSSTESRSTVYINTLKFYFIIVVEN